MTEPGGPARPALPGARMAGALVDGVLLRLASFLVAGLEAGPAAAIGSAAYLVYAVALVAVRGQTLGKLAVGTAVVDAATGARPTLWQAATRAVVPLAGAVLDVAIGTRVFGVFWVLVVYAGIVTDPTRRGLHDKAAGTMVVPRARSLIHRRVGTAAVAAAIAVTALLVLVSLDDLEDGAPSASRPPSAGRSGD